MRQATLIKNKDDAEGQSRGPYDPAPLAEEDLWFLPATEAVAEDAHLPPLPWVERRALFDAGEWRAAQDRLSGPLADLAGTFGALEERMHAGSAEQNAGWRSRLALLEVADLGWWSGERIGVERLALWVGLRLGATGEDAQALARAGWAVRRLTGGQGPAGDGDWGSGIAAFLGRSTPERGAVPEAVADLAEVMAGVDGLHPATQAAVLFHAWRMLGTEAPGQGAAHDIEAAVMAARLGATMGRGGEGRSGVSGRGTNNALFLPLALSGPTALRATGVASEKLTAWITGAQQATMAALLHLERIRDWQARAETRIADLSGRTPKALIRVFADWPMVSAPMAEEKTSASRAAIQRNLDTLARRGLIREVTGQGRYRVWAAAV